MPEGDAVRRTARRLAQALDGRVLTRTDFRVPQHATADLAGATVVETVSRGKHLLTRIDADGPVTLHTHLKMEGSWRVFEPGKRWNPPAHEIRVVLETGARRRSATCSASSSCSPATAEADAVGHLGPDLLGPDWDEAEALRRLLAEPDRPVFEALRDQTNLAGIGTIYAAEVCFVMGVAPDDAGRRRCRTCRGWSAGSGRCSTRTGRGRNRMWVYRQRLCRRCGTQVRVRPARPAGHGADGVLVPVLPAASGSRVDDAGRGRRRGGGSGRRRPLRAPPRSETSRSTSESGTSSAEHSEASSSEDASFWPRSISEM